MNCNNAVPASAYSPHTWAQSGRASYSTLRSMFNSSDGLYNTRSPRPMESTISCYQLSQSRNALNLLTFETAKLSAEVKGHRVISGWINAVGQSSKRAEC